jgi:RHS repeat-associated protein
LIDFVGVIVELYSFDAYGNAIGFDSSVTLTEFLYSGEQFDSKIGQQYLPQRYYCPVTGRFNRLDPFFGNLNDPQSLHKYLYTHADPVNGVDPSGLFSIGGMIGSLGAMLGSAKVGVAVVGSLGVVGGITGYFSNSVGAWWEGFLPGWGSGRGLGNALKNGDGFSVAFHALFLGVDLLTIGGLKLIMGNPSVTINATKTELTALYNSLKNIAESPEFFKRASAMGFTRENILGLLQKLEDYFVSGRIQIGQRLVAWADENVIKIGEWQLKRLSAMTHELTHLLDDVANGLFQSSQGLGWYQKVWGAEYRAAYVHSMHAILGKSSLAGHIYGLTEGLLTPIFNMTGTFPLFGIREWVYYESHSPIDRENWEW